MVVKLQELNYIRKRLKYPQSDQDSSKKTSFRTKTLKIPCPHLYNYYFQNFYVRSNKTYRDYYYTLPQSSQHLYYWDLTSADLQEKDLSGCELLHADLSYTDLDDSFLHKFNLQGSNSFCLNLFRVNLRSTNSQEMNLMGPNLLGTDLSKADLSDIKVGTRDYIMVNFTKVILHEAILFDRKAYHYSFLKKL